MDLTLQVLASRKFNDPTRRNLQRLAGIRVDEVHLELAGAAEDQELHPG